ncbi:MAG: hypothetical protein KGJ62_06205 [Armatimonadetes bacterium]|nr:hypothetical protein [Armatimonadota bacterium]MDE2205894.1 hypothetical protein [Armatimonadota bacterium]
MRAVSFRCTAVALAGLAIAGAAAAAAQTATKTPLPALRIRIHNSLFGAIEASSDGGEHWRLIGRVMRPANATVVDKAAHGVGVLSRSGRFGGAVCIGHQYAFYLLPGEDSMKLARESALHSESQNASIITNLPARHSLFGSLMPPAGSSVELQRDGHVIPIPDPYTPGTGDQLVVECPPPGSTPAAVADAARLTAVADRYASSAEQRAKVAGYPVVHGTLTIHANLPSDPRHELAAVMFAIDGQSVSAQNAAPFIYRWDTTAATNGEHVVEAQGLDNAGAVVTRRRDLVVVENPVPPNPAAGPIGSSGNPTQRQAASP